MGEGGSELQLMAGSRVQPLKQPARDMYSTEQARTASGESGLQVQVRDLLSHI